MGDEEHVDGHLVAVPAGEGARAVPRHGRMCAVVQRCSPILRRRRCRRLRKAGPTTSALTCTARLVTGGRRRHWVGAAAEGSRYDISRSRCPDEADLHGPRPIPAEVGAATSSVVSMSITPRDSERSTSSAAAVLMPVFPPTAAYDHREQSGWHLHHADSAQPGRGDEPGEVGRRSAAEADDRIATVKPASPARSRPTLRPRPSSRPRLRHLDQSDEEARVQARPDARRCLSERGMDGCHRREPATIGRSADCRPRPMTTS